MPQIRSYATVVNRVRGYVTECLSIDTRTLGVFRVFLGSILLIDVVLRLKNLRYFYTDAGVVPQTLAQQALSPSPFGEYTVTDGFSVFFLSGSFFFTAFLFIVLAFIAVQIVVGYRTRTATLMAFVLVVSLHNRNPLVLNYGDILLRMLVLWSIFLPLGERYSVDAVHRDGEPRKRFLGLASAAVLFQVVYVHFVNHLHKSQGETWQTGMAGVTTFGVDYHTTFIGDFLSSYPTVLRILSQAWYVLLLLSFLLIVLRGRKRILLISLFILGHIGIGLSMDFGIFPLVSMTGLLIFIPTEFWNGLIRVYNRFDLDTDRYRDRLTEMASALPNPTLGRLRGIEGTRKAMYFITLSVLCLVVLMSVPAVGSVLEDGQGKDIATEVGETLSVDQPDWAMFAPEGLSTDRYYVFAAETTDGEKIDVYNDRNLTYSRPYKNLNRQFSTNREMHYMPISPSITVNTGRYLAEYVCENHENQLTHINIWLVSEKVTPENADSPELRDVKDGTVIYRHGCDGREPKDVGPPKNIPQTSSERRFSFRRR